MNSQPKEIGTTAKPPVENKRKFPKGWQMGTRNINQRLCFLYYSKAFSDLTVEFEDGREFKVHKLILAMHSPMFERMFYGSLPCKEERVELKGVSSETFQWILSYMYLRIIVLEDLKLAMDVYAFAHEKQMDYVVARCSKFLSAKITTENALMLMNLANIYDDEELMTNAATKILEKRNSIFSSDEISYLPKIVLIDALASNKIQVSEKEKFNTICNWAKAHLRRKRIKITPITLREEMNEYLPHIHFLKMSPEQFLSQVMATEIFTASEATSILKRMYEVDGYIPEFLSQVMPTISVSEGERPSHVAALIKFPKCNTSFFYNHNEQAFSDKIIILKSSENVFINSFKLKTNCFTGSWKIRVTTREEREVAVSSNDSSPWTFESPIFLQADRSYICKIEGRGKRTKHKVIDYESCVNGITFSGVAINCNITLFYLT